VGTVGHTSVVLTRAHRDALLEEIQFAFACAGELPFMLEHAAHNAGDRVEARELVWRLRVGVRLLDQLGWQRKGEQDRYVVEVDEDIDRFAAGIAMFALASLEDSRRGLLDGDADAQTDARHVIDLDLDVLDAVRVVRTAFQLAQRCRRASLFSA
jgi:hypothetical protein